MNNQASVQRPTVDELSQLLHTGIRILPSVPNPNGRAVRIKHLVNETEFIIDTTLVAISSMTIQRPSFSIARAR